MKWTKQQPCEKWDKKSRDAQFLRDKVLSGDVDINTAKPSEIFARYPNMFQKYGLDKFRGAYNRLKAELNGAIDEPVSGSVNADNPKENRSEEVDRKLSLCVCLLLCLWTNRNWSFSYR